MRRTAAALFALAAVVSAAPGVLAAHGPHAGPPCTDADNEALPLTLTVDGQAATGYYALPDSPPKGIVVFSHGWTHGAASWKEHMRRTTQDHDVVSVAMDGRGLVPTGGEKAPGIPDYAGWPVMNGAEDGIAAAKHFEAMCPSARTIVNYGVSMGANTSGIMAASGATRANGQPLFDWWIAVEGVHNLVETYMEARAASPAATAHIEEETGGPIETHRDAYIERTNMAQLPKIKASGVRGVVLVHGLDDGTVPYNQSQEMFAGLTAAGIPAQFFTVAMKDTATERDSSGTGHVAGRIDPTYSSRFAGHGSERSETHTVIMTGFQRLSALLEGEVPSCTRAYLVNAGATHPGTGRCPALPAP